MMLTGLDIVSQTVIVRFFLSKLDQLDYISLAKLFIREKNPVKPSNDTEKPSKTQ